MMMMMLLLLVMDVIVDSSVNQVAGYSINGRGSIPGWDVIFS
jgi:hypothetical protein